MLLQQRCARQPSLCSSAVDCRVSSAQLRSKHSVAGACACSCHVVEVKSVVTLLLRGLQYVPAAHQLLGFVVLPHQQLSKENSACLRCQQVRRDKQ